MAYQLRFDRQFRRSLDALPGDIRSMVREVVAQLATNPRPARGKELDEHPGYYRVWLPRDHRLVWSVIEDERVVDLLYVGPKTRDLYERLGLGRTPSERDE
jgi:mRNA-degrading endonuclease RelE of RelBE toxin-antitoxin system